MSARATRLVVLAALATGCFSWQPVPLQHIASGERDIRTRAARVVRRNGAYDELVVHRVRYPEVEGRDARTGRERRVSLAGAYRVEASLPDRGGTAAWLFLGAVASGLVTFTGVAVAVVAASFR